MRRSIVLFVCFLMGGVTGAFADGESDARAAEQAGRYRDALNLYVQALKDKGGNDANLRERILRVAGQVSPPPAVPEEARRFHVRAETAIKLAKSPGEFKVAVSEFQRAIALAPWWADAYYNLGVAQEGAGDFAAAIAAMKLYLVARSNAADASQVRDRIYALEYKAEQQTRERRAAEQKRQQESAKQQASLQIAGNWEDSNRTTFRISVNGNKFEIQMTSYCAFGNCNQRRYSNRRYAFGTLEESKISGWLVVNGVDAENIDRSTGRPFPCRHPEGMAPVTLTLSPDGRSLKGKAKHGATNPSCIVMEHIVDLTRTN